LRRGASAAKPFFTYPQRHGNSKVIESATNLKSLKISAKGYERNGLNTLRNQADEF